MLSDEVMKSVRVHGWMLHPEISRQEPLGEGGGATVYRVYRWEIIENLMKLAASNPGDPQLGQKAFVVLDNVEAWLKNPGLFCGALKVPKKEEPRTKVEIRAMQEVRHPNLVRLLGKDEQHAENPMWFIMDYYPRGNPRVADYINDVSSVLRQGANLADALAALHRAGYFHRDIKPSNILVDNDGSWILADLGIVLDDDRTRHTEGSLPGSKDWMPPWRMSKTQFDARFDLFMLARTLHYFLVGEKARSLSWLRDDPDFQIMTKLSHLRGNGALQGFFDRYLVEKANDFPAADAYEVASELRALADLVSGQQSTKVLFSASSLSGLEWSNPPGLPFFVPAGTTRLTLCIHSSNKGEVTALVRDEAWQEIEDISGANEANQRIDFVVDIRPQPDQWLNVMLGGNAGPRSLFVLGA